MIGNGSYDPGVVAGSVEKAVKFADIGGPKTVVIVYDDVESDSGEGEDGKDGDQDVGDWETHGERNHRLQCVFYKAIQHG